MDPSLRTGSKWSKMEPPFSFTLENVSWALFTCNQRLNSDSYKLDIMPHGAWFTLSADFSIP